MPPMDPADYSMQPLYADRSSSAICARTSLSRMVMTESAGHRACHRVRGSLALSSHATSTLAQMTR